MRLCGVGLLCASIQQPPPHRPVPPPKPVIDELNQLSSFVGRWILPLHRLLIGVPIYMHADTIVSLLCMKILVFSWRGPRHPLAGGAEQVMHEHMKGWVAAGHEVTLFTSRLAGSPLAAQIDGITIVRSGYQYLGVQLAGFWYYLKNRSEFDFVVDQFHGIPFFTPLFSRKPKLAVIQEVAREVWFLNPFPTPLKQMVGVIGYIIEPLVYQLYRTTSFMTGSQSAKDELAGYGISKKNITVVPHGIKLYPTSRKDAKGEKEKSKTILFLGRLTPDKGIEDALGAFSILRKKGRYQFWIVGRAETKEYMDKLLVLCSHLGLDKKVKFWGHVSEGKKYELLSRAHLLVNPSVREGWGLVNIEANSVGSPVVAYPSQGLVDSVKDGVSGVLTKTKTAQALAWETERTLGNKKLYNKLARGAREWGSQFNWEVSKKKSLELIEKMYENS